MVRGHWQHWQLYGVGQRLQQPLLFRQSLGGESEVLAGIGKEVLLAILEKVQETSQPPRVLAVAPAEVVIYDLAHRDYADAPVMRSAVSNFLPQVRFRHSLLR